MLVCFSSKLTTILTCSVNHVRRECRRLFTMDDSPEAAIAEKLHSRCLLKIAGEDSSKFLQGLITNDMRHFEENGTGARMNCMYSLILNVQGRVIHDVIIYKTSEAGAFLIECDSKSSSKLINYLNTYRLRKKVVISDLSQTYSVWSIYHYKPSTSHMELKEIHSEIEQHIVGTKHHEPEDSLAKPPFKAGVAADDAVRMRDPRLRALGCRLLLKSSFKTPSEVLETEPAEIIDGTSESKYTMLRYQLGIGEGPTDLPPGECNPLESNVDYLHGVSFLKGCYVGQELTARTHHTGVIRKRLMPMAVLNAPVSGKLTFSILTPGGKPAGKLRGAFGSYALGLLRIQECLSSDKLIVATEDGKHVELGAVKPGWWAPEATKDRQEIAAAQENSAESVPV